ncbi:class I SAM-dependent rRNA methyltransferase [Paenibacillus chartarius]|uniref:Class I SAM-dependent rRNA methyltransferase n=1 Tax=Paenibacillus chartarius TaxID=747481 RepID=A0ABV6DHC7_9BACL
MAAVILTRSRKKRLEAGHPWVFGTEIETVEGEPQPGAVVGVYDHARRFVASGYYNAASQIRVRVVDYKPVGELDTAWFRERFERCRAHRDRFVPGADACRLVYGEADLLPGLIVDRFGDVLVVQILTLGMDVRRESIVTALVDVFGPSGIFERSDVHVRELEGLEQRTGVLYGDCPRHVRITENDIQLEVDIVEGQKTGYFFDQRENRAALKPLMTGWGRRSGIELRTIADADGVERTVPVNASGKEVTFPYWDGATVLECFSHTGSFTLHACKYGAKKVTCLDISEHAIDSARRNVELNGFGDRVEFVVADAFDYLRKQVQGLDERRKRSQAGSAGAGGKIDTSKPLASEGRTWDVVILDPPAFAKNRQAVEGACRGYKDINLHGMKLVNEGGYLVTASCSYHVRPDLFLETIHAAANDAGKILRLVDFRGAGKDHPQLLGVDEGNYLKFAVFEVRSRR